MKYSQHSKKGVFMKQSIKISFLLIFLLISQQVVATSQLQSYARFWESMKKIPAIIQNFTKTILSSKMSEQTKSRIIIGGVVGISTLALTAFVLRMYYSNKSTTDPKEPPSATPNVIPTEKIPVKSEPTTEGIGTKKEKIEEQDDLSAIASATADQKEEVQKEQEEDGEELLLPPPIREKRPA